MSRNPRLKPARHRERQQQSESCECIESHLNGWFDIFLTPNPHRGRKKFLLDTPTFAEVYSRAMESIPPQDGTDSNSPPGTVRITCQPDVQVRNQGF